MKLTLNQQIFMAAVGGIGGGLLLSHFGVDTPLGKQVLFAAGLVGSVFVNLLKMVLIPLVFTSIAVGIANLRAHAQMKKVWQLSLLYYISTTALAICLGMIVINIFKPGVGVQITMFQDAMNDFQLQSLSVPQFVEHFLGNLFLNPFEAMANGMVLPTIIFAIFVGVALVMMGEKAKHSLALLNESFEIIMLIVQWIMKLLPIGIMALLIKLIATQDPSLFQALGKFMAVVIGATLFHGFVTLPIILVIFTRMDLRVYYRAVRKALITAFSTSSSAATLPVTYECMTKDLKVNRDVAGFVLPLGATINMDGTALYEAVAALFIANLVGIDLNVVQQLVVFFMAIIASIGAPGIPSAGMVTMLMVLQSVGLPAEAVAILYPIDRLLDAFRTMVNVKGDTIGSLIVDKVVSSA